MSATAYLRAYIKLLRPAHYTKNLLIFVPMVFARQWDSVVGYGIGFVSFCFLSSAIYVLNDIWDREADRKHPYKKYRPIAAGVIAPTEATGVAMGLLLASAAAGLYVGKHFWLFQAAYILNNLLYSWKLKHVQLLDVFSIAAGFVIRVFAGGAIASVPISAYLYLTVLFLSLYFALGKRRYELQITEGATTRKVLHSYSVYYLDQLMVIAATLTLGVYAHYVIQSELSHLVWTVPVVVFGIFRYYHLTHNMGQGEPTRELLNDPYILGAGLVYVGIVLIESLWKAG
ncbi:MAG: UbiA prenyltransferase family protein [Bacteroidia bacterium]